MEQTMKKLSEIVEDALEATNPTADQRTIRTLAQKVAAAIEDVTPALAPKVSAGSTTIELAAVLLDDSAGRRATKARCRWRFACCARNGHCWPNRRTPICAPPRPRGH
jgi:hypothetical protein